MSQGEQKSEDTVPARRVEHTGSADEIRGGGQTTNSPKGANLQKREETKELKRENMAVAEDDAAVRWNVTSSAARTARQRHGGGFKSGTAEAELTRSAGTAMEGVRTTQYGLDSETKKEKDCAPLYREQIRLGGIAQHSCYVATRTNARLLAGWLRARHSNVAPG